jgi:aspartate aminotransferase
MGFSENISRLQPSATIAVSTLAKKLTAEGRDIINLSAGEPDFDTPTWISDGAVGGIRDGRTRYTPTPGMPALRQAIAGFMAHESGRAVTVDGIVVSNGAKQSLFNAAFTLFGPGDEVLIGSPYWTSYPQIVTLARAEPVFVAGAESREFLLAPEDLDRAATHRTKGLILSSPSNPTGAVYGKAELEAVARWSRDRGVWLITDEIYRHIYYGAEESAAAGLLSLPADALGDFVLIDGVSKSWAMTGWRIGYAYTAPEVAGKMSALQSHMTSNAAAPSQMAALTAYGDPERALASAAEMTAAFRRRRDLVTGLFRQALPDLPFVEPRGAFYLFFRVDSLFDEDCADSSAWCTRMLEETGVAMVPGVAFGDDRFVRLSFATSDELLEQAIHRLAEAVTGAGAAGA